VGDSISEPAAADAGLAELAKRPLQASVLLTKPELGASLVLQSRARLRLAQRRPEDAVSDLLDAADRWPELGVRHPVFASWRVEAVEAFARLGDHPTSARLAAEQVELAGRLGTPGALGAALRTMARAAPSTERIGLLERAVELLARSPAQLEHTRALIELGSSVMSGTAERPAPHGGAGPGVKGNVLSG
jgi:hypothetical protein